METGSASANLSCTGGRGATALPATALLLLLTIVLMMMRRFHIVVSWTAVRSPSQSRSSTAVAPLHVRRLQTTKIDFTPIWNCATQRRPLLMHNIRPGVSADQTHEATGPRPYPAHTTALSPVGRIANEETVKAISTVSITLSSS